MGFTSPGNSDMSTVFWGMADARRTISTYHLRADRPFVGYKDFDPPCNGRAIVPEVSQSERTTCRPFPAPHSLTTNAQIFSSSIDPTSTNSPSSSAPKATVWTYQDSKSALRKCIPRIINHSPPNDRPKFQDSATEGTHPAFRRAAATGLP
jgi:hypothetical protein